MNRARPSVELADISISRAFHGRFESDRTIAVDSKNPAISSAPESSWVTPIREPSIPLNDLIEVLEDNLSTVDGHLQSIERLRQDLPRLKEILSRVNTDDAVDAAEFFDLWEQNDGLIYGSIRGNFDRGLYELPNTRPAYPEPGILLLDKVGRTSDGIVYGASKRGGFYISILPPKKAEHYPLNQFAAQALVYFDRGALQKMLDLAAAELPGRLLHEKMRDSIDKYLIGLSRWSISVVASNAGGTPLSIAPKAQLIVNSKGTKLDEQRIVLALELRDQDGNLTPASVPAGESRSVRFVSAGLISDFPKWETLYEMYQNSSLDCILLVEITPAPTFGEKHVLSTVRRFGQIEPFAEIDLERIEKKF